MDLVIHQVMDHVWELQAGKVGCLRPGCLASLLTSVLGKGTGGNCGFLNKVAKIWTHANNQFGRRQQSLYWIFLMIRTTGRSDPIRTIGQLLLTGRRKANRILGFDSDNGEHQATPAISTGKCCQNYIKSRNQNFGLNNRTSGKSGHRQYRRMCVRVSYRTTGQPDVR